MSLFLAATLSFLLSLTSKLLADAYLSERISLFGSFAGLQPAQNPGVAFGVQLPPSAQPFLILVALLCVFLLALRTARSMISRIGFGLILGGAFANVVDRLSDGFVTDFFQAGSFPVFNVADSCITIGAGLLIFEGAWDWVRKKKRYVSKPQT